MSEEKGSALVWFRNDLRTVDHKGLKKALDSGHKVIAYYTFNPRHYETLEWGFKKTERFRGQFLIESVRALKATLEALNISLIIDSKPPEKSLPKWIKKHKVKQIYLQHEWTQDEKREEEALAQKIDPSILLRIKKFLNKK